MSERTSKIGAAIKEAKRVPKKMLALGGAIALIAAGCGGGIKSWHDAEPYAWKDYRLTHKKASPVGKYVMQYVFGTKIDILKANGNGNNKYHRFTFGNNCLYNSAYDITGGHINGSGNVSGLEFGFVFGSVDGSVQIQGRQPSTEVSSTIDPKNADVLLVHSVDAKVPTLSFRGVSDESDFLHAANPQTQRVLDAYGCRPAGVNYQHFYGRSGETSSFVIRTPNDETRPQP